jgi:glycosyltransferase involved in cell wall biosynthesis
MSSQRLRPVLVQVNSLELGGTQINAVDLAWAVREFGYESHLVGPRDSRPVGPSLVEVAAERSVSLAMIDRPQTIREGAHFLRMEARRRGSALIHTYGTWSARFAYWGPCRLGRLPLVSTVYEMSVDPQVVYGGTSLIVGTKYLWEEQQGRRGAVSLISPPVDLDRDDPLQVDVAKFMAEHELDARQTIVVVVSRLDDETLRPIKCSGIEAAMGAVRAMDRDNLTLVVVGTGNARSRLEDLAARVNAARGRRAVVMAGPMSDPRPAYAVADIVLGMGGSAARALSFGKPLIVAGEFGTAELFTPETAPGIFRSSFWSEEVRPDPGAEMMSALLEVVDSPGRRDQLGAYGRSFARENFGLSAMAERLAAVYAAAERYSPTDWASDLPLEARAIMRARWRRLRGGG